METGYNSSKLSLCWWKRNSGWGRWMDEELWHILPELRILTATFPWKLTMHQALREVLYVLSLLVLPIALISSWRSSPEKWSTACASRITCHWPVHCFVAMQSLSELYKHHFFYVNTPVPSMKWLKQMKIWTRHCGVSTNYRMPYRVMYLVLFSSQDSAVELQLKFRNWVLGSNPDCVTY